MIVPHTFSLNDAALSGGAAIVAAGSGLPARITGAIDYEARVMALGPSGYWPLNEASGDFLDRTANARHLTPSVNGTRADPGLGLGGSPSLCVFPNKSVSGNSVQTAGGIFAEHGLTVGVPFTALSGWRGYPMNENMSKAILGSTQAVRSSATSVGWTLQEISTGLPIFMLTGDDAYSYAQLRCSPQAEPRGSWTTGAGGLCGIRYSGGDPMSMASWSFVVGGRIKPPIYIATRGTSIVSSVGSAALTTGVAGVTDRFQQQHFAIWNSSALSDAEIASLGSTIPCGTARWTLPTSTAARTLKGIEIPGSLARSISSTESRLGVRAYYQIGAGARTEFDPGDDLSVAIPAGSACYLDADLTHHHLDDLPWIADANGNGPVVLVDEPDPANIYVIEPLAVTVQDVSALSVTVQDLDQIRVTVED